MVSKNTSMVTGLLSALIGSLCCILPFLGILGGFGGFASSFSWTEPLRPYLIGLTIGIFALAWYRQLRRPKNNSCDCETNKKKCFWHSSAFLIMVTIFAALVMTFPYYAVTFYPKTIPSGTVLTSQSRVETMIFKIKGMNCESCTREVNSQLAAVPGVISFQTSLKKAQTLVRFDRNQLSENRIRNAINRSGYLVVSTQH